MAVYTVHEPPLGAADALANPERFAFVRDGFSVWAFLVSALWMLWHRMWLVLAIYVVVAAGLEIAMRRLGVSVGMAALVGLFISLLIGIEAGTLRCFMLARKGWKNIALVSGNGVEDAERRFFDVWVSDPRGPRTGPSSPAAFALPRKPPASDVIGLFPEPGVNR